MQPRSRLLPFREQELDALTPRVDGVVTLIFVVLQRRVVPDPIAQLRKRITILQCEEQLIGSLRKGPLIFLVSGDAAIQFCERGLPSLPARKDRTEIPRVFLV